MRSMCLKSVRDVKSTGILNITVPLIGPKHLRSASLKLLTAITIKINVAHLDYNN